MTNRALTAPFRLQMPHFPLKYDQAEGRYGEQGKSISGIGDVAVFINNLNGHVDWSGNIMGKMLVVIGRDIEDPRGEKAKWISRRVEAIAREGERAKSVLAGKRGAGYGRSGNSKGKATD